MKRKVLASLLCVAMGVTMIGSTAVFAEDAAEETTDEAATEENAEAEDADAEEAAAAWQGEASSREQEGKTFRIYGIGNTLQTVTDLDNGLLQGFVYQNEFNMGYEGIQTLVDKEKKGYFTEQVNIKYKLVTQDTLYESDNERLLFPSI